MRRLFLLALLVLLCAIPAHGQSTTVSGQIVDSGGQTWFAGTIQFTFRVSPSNPSAQYMWNGAPFSSSSTFPQNPLSLDGTGSFSGLSIPSNTAIAPAGSTWIVTVCPAATVPNCYTKGLTITGATQNISSQVVPPPVVVNFSVPIVGARAYTDAEVVGASPGAIYLNVTDNTLHVCVQTGFPPCTWESQTSNPSPVFNTVLYIGGANSLLWGGGDIGSQANVAYAFLPATGGKIVVLPNSTGPGACYLYNTSIEFTAVSKYVIFAGSSPPQISPTGAVSGGSCIQYTHVTATHAVDLDWTPTGGGGYMPGGGIRDLVIANSATEGSSTQCTTNGGCGSLATGVFFGKSNGGVHEGYFENLAIKGFGVDLDQEDAGGIGWGSTFNNVGLVLGTVGWKDGVGHENQVCTGCVIAVNTTGSQWNGTPNVAADITFIAGSVDSNLSVGLSGSNYIYNSHAVHYENLGVTSNKYIAGTMEVYLSGGKVIDDNSGGSSSQDWFEMSQGSMNGFSWFGGNGGRTYTGLLAFSTGHIYVQGVNSNITAFPDLNNICLPTLCTANITAGTGPFASVWSLVLTGSFVSIGQATNSSIFYVRDDSVGGTAIATVDNAATNVALSGAAGASAGATFVVGSPSGNQIGLQYSGGSLQVAGAGAAIGQTLRYTQTLLR